MTRRSLRSQWWRDLRIVHKGRIVVALPVLIFVATVLLRVPFNRQQEATTAALARASETSNTTQEVLIAMLDVETGTRGYVLTRDRKFLEPFESALRDVPARLERLSARVSDDTERRLHDQAVEMVRRELDLSGELVGLTDRGAAPQSEVIQKNLLASRDAMDGIRTALGELRGNDERTVAASQEALQRIRRRLAPFVLITFFGGLVGAVVAGWLFATGISRRIVGLERNAERLAHGIRLRFEPSRGRDEIGSLDVTLRRAALLIRSRDRELRRVNEELQRGVHDQLVLNRELEAFSYSVSHDLRAPLRSIDGFAQALREDFGEGMDEVAQQHLSRVRNAAQRMGRLIDDLLKLSALSRAPIERLDVDLSTLARTIAAEFVERNPTRAVEWAIADGLHAHCDLALARIVLENLLGNAWKFTSKTAVARIEFQAVPETSPALFVIRDNGAGFDMKYVDKLFSPFQRLHGDREFPGTGIGLATVQRIVHKHGGQVRTRGEVNGGAAFYFTLEPPGAVRSAA